jgi:hypothetical protein
MSAFLVSIRPYLESAYFIAGMLLVFGVIIAFRQIALIKRDIRIRNERAAKEHAIHACSRYLSELVAKTSIADRDLDKAKVGHYDGTIGDFSIHSISKENLLASRKRMVTLSILHVLNELEAISAYFTTGVADERTGFQIIGRSYCRTVEAYYDVISLCRSELAHPYWHNIVQLYSTWRPRLSKAELEHVMHNIEDTILSLGSDPGINPIGQ